jgi:ferrous iron transport protein A
LAIFVEYIMHTLLSELKPGEHAIIKSIADNAMKTKLIEMGCFPGEELYITKIAPLGCPFAIYVSGYELSLRQNEAMNIVVERLN